MTDRTHEPQIYTTQITGKDVAHRALSGEPVLIYPLGTHHRRTDDGTRTWTVTEETIDDLLANYEHRLDRGIRQKRLPVNEEHRGRALGWFESVTKTPDGLAATFTWNPKGQDALENGEFAYFSVEICDKILDRVTGETVKNQITGGALTNYPYFGEATALMSRRPTTQEATMPNEREVPQDTWLKEQFEKLISQFSTAPRPAGQPDAAPAVQAIRDEMRAEFERQAQEIEDRFTAQLESAETQRDTYATQIEELRGQLSTAETARARERYTRMAQDFSHVPAQTADLADHLHWLHDADTAGEHAEFFMRLLQKTDDAFASQFQALQMRHDHSLDTAENQLHTMAMDYANENGVTYSDALTHLIQTRPDLAQQYNSEASGGAQ